MPCSAYVEEMNLDAREKEPSLWFNTYYWLLREMVDHPSNEAKEKAADWLGRMY